MVIQCRHSWTGKVICVKSHGEETQPRKQNHKTDDSPSFLDEVFCWNNLLIELLYSLVVRKALLMVLVQFQTFPHFTLHTGNNKGERELGCGIKIVVLRHPRAHAPSLFAKDPLPSVHFLCREIGILITSASDFLKFSSFFLLLPTDNTSIYLRDISWSPSS